MPGAPVSQGKTSDSREAGGLACPNSLITPGLGSSGSSLRSFLIQLFIGVTAENKARAVSMGILISFYEFSWFSIPMCNRLFNPTVGAVSTRCLLRPAAAGSPLPLGGLGTPGTFGEAVLVPWPCWCCPGPTAALCHQGRCQLVLAWMSRGFAGAAEGLFTAQATQQIKHKNRFFC